MTEMGTEASEYNSDNQTVFECEFCASRQTPTSVSYNWYGYPVCPACNYEHGPRGRFNRRGGQTTEESSN